MIYRPFADEILPLRARRDVTSFGLSFNSAFNQSVLIKPQIFPKACPLYQLFDILWCELCLESPSEQPSCSKTRTIVLMYRSLVHRHGAVATRSLKRSKPVECLIRFSDIYVRSAAHPPPPQISMPACRCRNQCYDQPWRVSSTQRSPAAASDWLPRARLASSASIHRLSAKTPIFPLHSSSLSRFQPTRAPTAVRSFSFSRPSSPLVGISTVLCFASSSSSPRLCL